MYSTFTTRCIRSVWLVDQGSHLWKRVFQKGEIYIGATFDGECFIVTNHTGQDFIMSKNTLNTDNLIDWFKDHFKILSNFIA